MKILFEVLVAVTPFVVLPIHDRLILLCPTYETFSDSRSQTNVAQSAGRSSGQVIKTAEAGTM
jgi:hypothetical protein